MSRHAFDCDKMAGQRKCNDDHSDFWVGPATPSLLTSWNFFLHSKDTHLQILCILFIFFHFSHLCVNGNSVNDGFCNRWSILLYLFHLFTWLCINNCSYVFHKISYFTLLFSLRCSLELDTEWVRSSILKTSFHLHLIKPVENSVFLLIFTFWNKP